MQSPAKSQRLNLLFYLGIAVLAISVGVLIGKGVFQRGGAIPLPQGNRHVTLLPEPRPLEAFSLADHHGRPFTPDSLKGRWSFVFFGYTHCPDICPSTLSMLNVVAQRLASAPGGGDDARFVFVSVDPERDSVAELARYIPYFNPEFIGVTGAPDQIKALSTSMGIMSMRAPDSESKENYQVDHSSSIMLVDPQGRWRALFPAPHDVAAIVDEFTKIRAD